MNRRSELNMVFGIVMFALVCISPVWAQSEHVVAKGDTLSSISKKAYGTSSKWKVIYEANKDVIKNKGLIRVGLKLKIPPTSEPVSKDAVITLLYFNDYHGTLEPEMNKRTVIREDKKVEEEYEAYGIARLAGMVKTIQKENRSKDIPTFLMNSGDFLQGRVLSNHFAGQIEAEIYNKIGLSFYAIGNHELDFGLDNLLKLVRSIKAKCVTENLKLKATGKYIGQSQIIHTKGIKIGVAGLLTTADFNEKDLKVDPKLLKDVAVEDEFKRAMEIVSDLRNKGADIVVFLTHLGFDTDKKLAQTVKGIDVIIGGDSHSKVSEKLDNTYIVQAQSYGRYLGRMDISVREGKPAAIDTKLISLETVTPDDEIAKIVREKQAELSKDYDQVIAENDCLLEGEKTTIRNNETTLGNLVADILKDHFKTDIAILNSGGIKGTVKAGKIRKKDVFNVMPYLTNTPHILTLSGKELLEVLKHGANKKNSGGFLQVSGLSFEINSRVGIRGDVKVKGQKLDENKMYKVVTSSYISDGGDGYEMLKAIPADRRDKREENIAEIVIKSVEKTYGKKGRHVSYCKPEGRIVISD